MMQPTPSPSESQVQSPSNGKPRAAANAPAGDRSGWKLGFQSLEEETAPYPRELEVTGTIPTELEGTLHRIGPARHDVYGSRNRHWFDGDGMVFALQLQGGRVLYQNRFVATTGKAREDEQHRRLYGGFGTRAPGSPLRRFLHRGDHKNPMNTNVVVHGGKLLALCEGGAPVRMDPTTLATMGVDDLGGLLCPGDTFSAHPKLDRHSGEMWNFGLTYGKPTQLSVFCTARDGETRRVARFALPFMAMVHDFALTASKAVFVVVPVKLPTVPLGMMLGQRSFGESLRYAPEAGTQIAVVDRESGAVEWHTGEPFMMFHTINAWDEGSEVVVDVCAYPDGAILTTLTDVMSGTTPTRAYAWAERLRIPAGAGGGGKRVARRRLSDVPLEFPRVAGRVLGAESSVTYGATWPESSEFMSTPAAIDLKTGGADLAPLVAGEFTGELVPVTKTGATSERDVWLLTVVLDANRKRSELRVLDGNDLSAPPVARAPLPHVMPLGFHGNWTARSTIN
jgi:all-trans-8'-apo-beta-carotenal 15,15'-oxygenase